MSAPNGSLHAGANEFFPSWWSKAKAPAAAPASAPRAPPPTSNAPPPAPAPAHPSAPTAFTVPPPMPAATAHSYRPPTTTSTSPASVAGAGAATAPTSMKPAPGPTAAKTTSHPPLPTSTTATGSTFTTTNAAKPGPPVPLPPTPSRPAPPTPATSSGTSAPTTMSVTRTTTNATTAITPSPYVIPRSVPVVNGTAVSPLLGGVSPGLSSRSPNLARNIPVRMSPAVFAAPHPMNPNAAEFVPGRGVLGGADPNHGLEALPTSTADLEAEQKAQQPAVKKTSPAWQPTYRRSLQSSPAMGMVRLDHKSEMEILEISRQSALKVDADVYNPRRTMTRLVLSKPSPLSLVPSADPVKANIEMMLDDLWCLFYLPANLGESIKEETYNPTLVFRIESIPTFWKVFNNIPQPTELNLSTLYLFRDGIDPKWEDPANRDGGIVKVKVDSAAVDEAWELLLCKTMGDSWSPAVRNTVNGVALKVRERAFLLEVWVTKQSPELMRDLAELWQGSLGGAFATAYYSHAALQERAQAAAAALAEKQKKQQQQRRRH